MILQVKTNPIINLQIIYQHNFKSKKDEKNVKNKSRPATIFHKLLNTDKGNQKDKRIYNTLISNEIYGRGFYKNSLQNKSENILNIKELKLKANSSVRVKKSDINNNNNNNNNYNFSTNNNVINSKYLKTSTNPKYIKPFFFFFFSGFSIICGSRSIKNPP